jgi:hypothetical protein
MGCHAGAVALSPVNMPHPEPYCRSEGPEGHGLARQQRGCHVKMGDEHVGPTARGNRKLYALTRMSTCVPSVGPQRVNGLCSEYGVRLSQSRHRPQRASDRVVVYAPPSPIAPGTYDDDLFVRLHHCSDLPVPDFQTQRIACLWHQLEYPALWSPLFTGPAHDREATALDDGIRVGVRLRLQPKPAPPCEMKRACAISVGGKPHQPVRTAPLSTATAFACHVPTVQFLGRQRP